VGTVEPNKGVLIMRAKGCLVFLVSVLAMAVGLAGGGGFSSSCDTWVALQDATADGSVILAKNSDRPTMEAQVLVHFPRNSYKPGAKVQCTYIEIPQVAETYENTGSKIWWTYGYEHGMNEHGVAIGNEAVFSREPYQWEGGLLGMDLLRLALERGKNSYEAMHVIIDLLAEYGQGGDCEYPGEFGKSYYHNSFIIADPKEAWVLETAGKYWVAKKIERGVYSISNIYSIEREWDEAHSRLVEHAIEKGWTDSRKDFNFAQDYGDYWGKDSPDPGRSQIRRNETLRCLQRDYTRITPASMMKINRIHHEGTVVAPRWGPPETFWPSPCLHDSPRSGYRTAASMVAHLRAEMPPLLRQVYWAGFSNPCCNLFKPFYLHGPKVPANYTKGTSTYSADSPYWWAKRVRLLCDLNYRALNPAVRGIFDLTEQWELERQRTYEADALKLIRNGNSEAAALLLQGFIDENCARAEREYSLLNKTLTTMIETVGIDYLYADYAKAWTAEKEVPLPILQIQD
jgi:dipeptidase